MSAGASIKHVQVKDIKAKLLRPALTSHYVCNFGLPPGGFIGARIGDVSGTKLYDRLTLACFDASLPGSTLATHDINNDFTGVSEKHAYRRLYDDRADFSFYVDAEEYYAIRFFESWIASCVDEQNQDISKASYSYRVNYPNTYCSDGVSITKFERSTSTAKLQYNFVKAFPVSINSIPVSYESSELLKCTVSFAYSRYWISNLSTSSNPSSSSSSTSTTSSTSSSSNPQEPTQPTPNPWPGLSAKSTPQEQSVFNTQTLDLFSNQSSNIFNISSGTVFNI